MATGQPYLASNGKVAYAPQAGPLASGLNAYTYEPDSRGGINYYLNGKGITNAQYGAATGSDYGALERQAGQDFLTRQASGSGAYSGAYSSSGSSSRATDPSAAAAYNNQADSYQNQYNALDGQLTAGQSNLENSYNSQLNDLNDSNAIAQRNYNTQDATNTQNFVGTKSNILSNTRASANSLQRMLNLNGAGNSSAALEAAPYAAALQGSQNLNGAQTTYAQNKANLDTTWQDTQRSYKKNMDALSQNKFAQQQNLQSQIAQQRIALLNQISGAKQQAGIANGLDYGAASGQNAQREAQVKDLLASLTGYANQYQNPVPVNTNVSFNAPTAQDYSLGREATIGNGQSGAASDIATPFLNLLTGRKNEYGQAY